MARRPDPLPAALGPVFTAAESRALGVHPRRLLQPDVIRLVRGRYARATPAEEAPTGDLHPAELWRSRQRELARRLAPLLPPGAFFARRTAAALWRLPVPMPRPLRGAPVGSGGGAAELGGLDVACFLPGEGPRARGLNLTRVDPRYATAVVRDGVPVTDAASTWAMLAPELGRDDGVALGDAAIREARIPGTTRLERPPHASLAELETLAALPYRRGARALREYLPLLSPHAASAPESHLRLRLLDWRAPRPCLDHDVYSAGGLLLGCSEFAYPEYRLAVEYEGAHHESETRQWNRDIDKYHDYERAGWDVIRVTSDYLYRRGRELREHLFESLRKRGWAG